MPLTLLQRSFLLAQQIFPERGTCLEFGVYNGKTYIWQAEQIINQYPNTKLIGFDSWQGLPNESENVWCPGRHTPGKFTSAKDIVIEKLKDIGSKQNDRRFQFVDGFYENSLTDEVRKAINDVIFINVDVDLYKSTIELLDFVHPILRPGIIIYWDDWKDPRDKFEGEWGEHKAWHEWSAKHPEIVAEVIEITPLNHRNMIITSVCGKTCEDAGLDLCNIRRTAFNLYQN